MAGSDRRSDTEDTSTDPSADRSVRSLHKAREASRFGPVQALPRLIDPELPTHQRMAHSMKWTITDMIMVNHELAKGNDYMKVRLEEARARRQEVKLERQAKREAKKASRHD